MTDLRFVLVAAALIGASCKAAPTAPASVPVSQGDRGASNGQAQDKEETASGRAPVVRRDIKDGVELASDWLDALARNDLEALTRQTGFPFQLHHSAAEQDCGPRSTAATAAELPSVIACLTSNATLLSVLQKHSGGGFDALSHDDVQPWAKQWQAELRPGWRLVTAYFERGDATVELDLVVADDGIRALWKTDGLDATVEAQLAAEWLSALRSGNVESLSRVTRYPFEVRDRGRGSTCGTRTAAGSDALGRTVQCLTANKVLLEAMRDSPGSPPVVYRSADQLPDWAHGWWEKQSNPAVKIVTYLVATNAGYEFDLLLLVDKAGVHALWKSGSFESTN
jgi:hypothetical protein